MTAYRHDACSSARQRQSAVGLGKLSVMACQVSCFFVGIVQCIACLLVFDRPRPIIDAKNAYLVVACLGASSCPTRRVPIGFQSKLLVLSQHRPRDGSCTPSCHEGMHFMVSCHVGQSNHLAWAYLGPQEAKWRLRGPKLPCSAVIWANLL